MEEWRSEALSMMIKLKTFPIVPPKQMIIWTMKKIFVMKIVVLSSSAYEAADDVDDDDDDGDEDDKDEDEDGTEK